MTSQINPNDINGAYPVAGQDNNSQGFRDNFTNTRTNFQYAADEITALQANVLLKGSLGLTPVDNNVDGNLLYNFQAKQVSETLDNLGGPLSGSQTLNWALGSYKTITSTNGSVSLAFSNWPSNAASIVLEITISSEAHTLTFPAAVSVNNAGIQGLNASTNVITFAATGTYTFQFSTVDAGSTITVSEVNKEIQPFNNTSEDLANVAGANLALTTSYFTTAGAETATLAAGVAGQIKVFTAVNVSAGNMVITVTNAGWKASGTGTITFSGTYGVGCTLQYTNSKWYCIGNNGCTFG